jgi:hypothetical protein
MALGPAGYAIDELYAGTLSSDGKFTDLIQYVPGRTQTVTWASSFDPWHAASDLDVTKGDQIGFDFLLQQRDYPWASCHHADRDAVWYARGRRK